LETEQFFSEYGPDSNEPLLVLESCARRLKMENNQTNKKQTNKQTNNNKQL